MHKMCECVCVTCSNKDPNTIIINKLKIKLYDTVIQGYETFQFHISIRNKSCRLKLV